MNIGAVSNVEETASVAPVSPTERVNDIIMPAMIENLIIGSKWVMYAAGTKPPYHRKPLKGRIKFRKEGNRIVARVTEQAEDFPVGSIYFELTKKVDSNTFIAKRYRTGSKPPEKIFMKFPIIKNELRLFKAPIKFFGNDTDLVFN